MSSRFVVCILMPMITSRIPGSWEELESLVAEILTKSGLAVDRQRSVETVRGSVDVDVHAVQAIRDRHLVILCECKHWRAAVPKTVVHAFRTVVQDSGAHVGYIISSSGFQKGAITAAKKSNVQLVTWEEFQAGFESDYYEHYFKPQLRACVDPLVSYVEPFSPGSFVLSGRLPEENVERFRALIPKYEDFAMICLPVYLGWRRIYGTDRLPLPLSTVLPPDRVLPQSDLAEISDYEGFLACASEIATEGLAQFRSLLRPRDDVQAS